MTTARGLLWMAIMLWLTLGIEAAQAVSLGPNDSDVLFEAIIDQNGKIVNTPLTFGPIREGTPQDVTFTVPALRVNFVQSDGTTLSDIFFFNAFTVRIRSDGNPGGMPARPGVPQIDQEQFVTDIYICHSDALSGPNGTTSDTCNILIAVGPHGNRDDIPGSPFILSEGSTQTVPFTIPARSYDVLERVPGSIGPVSDYLDFSTITGGFCSDNPDGTLPDCSNGLPVNGIVVEDPSGQLAYNLIFASDVPEPSTWLMFGTGLVGLLAYRGYWRKPVG